MNWVTERTFQPVQTISWCTDLAWTGRYEVHPIARRAAMSSECDTLIESWREILNDLRRVLSQLDNSTAPADVGAYIDCGICRLEEALSELLNAAKTA